MAISLSHQVIDLLVSTQHKLKQQVPAKAIHWVARPNLHLTLRFLGETEVTQLSSIQQSLDAWAVDYEPFVLNLGKLSYFANRKRPRIIWVGMQGWGQRQQKLKQALDAVLVPYGWSVEKRPFRPHLTLGRVKHSYHHVNKLPFGDALPPLEIGVSAIHVIESELHPAGAVYRVRHSVSLGNG